MRIPIVLPSIASLDTGVIRSSLALVRRNGDMCIRGEPIAYCTLSPSRRSNSGENSFSTYADELFAVILAPTDGVVNWESGVSRQGWPDMMASVGLIEWRQEMLLGHLTVGADHRGSPLTPLHATMIAHGRRFVDFADNRAGLLSGWYEFTRTWRFTGDLSSLSFLTTCSHRYAVLGEQRSSHEFMLAAPRPLHLTYFADTQVLPAIQSLREELERTSEERDQILEAFRPWLRKFVGPESSSSRALLSAILQKVEQGSPLLQPQKVLQADGIKEVSFPGSVVLSAITEEARILKHKTLPLTVSWPQWLRLSDEATVFLDDNFVLAEAASAEELSVAYRAVASKLRARGAKVFVMNYFVMEPGAPILRPAWLLDIKKAYSYRARSINEMLQSLEKEGLITVIDVDSAIGRVGGQHLLGGAHADFLLDQNVRELLIREVA